MPGYRGVTDRYRGDMADYRCVMNRYRSVMLRYSLNMIRYKSGIKSKLAQNLTAHVTRQTARTGACGARLARLRIGLTIRVVRRD